MKVVLTQQIYSFWNKAVKSITLLKLQKLQYSEEEGYFQKKILNIQVTSMFYFLEVRLTFKY
jgi:hypothetical protein